jgi:hypothetical protein
VAKQHDTPEQLRALSDELLCSLSLLLLLSNKYRRNLTHKLKQLTDQSLADCLSLTQQ